MEPDILAVMKRAEGLPAVDFRLEDTLGGQHRLADYRGSWLLLVFHRHLA